MQCSKKFGARIWELFGGDPATFYVVCMVGYLLQYSAGLCGRILLYKVGHDRHYQ